MARQIWSTRLALVLVIVLLVCSASLKLQKVELVPDPQDSETAPPAHQQQQVLVETQPAVTASTEEDIANVEDIVLIETNHNESAHAGTVDTTTTTDTVHQQEDDADTEETSVGSSSILTPPSQSEDVDSILTTPGVSHQNDEQQQQQQQQINQKNGGVVRDAPTLILLSEEEMNLYFEDDDEVVKVVRSLKKEDEPGSRTSTADVKEVLQQENESNDSSSVPSNVDTSSVKAESLLPASGVEQEGITHINGTTKASQQEHSANELIVDDPRDGDNNETRVVESSDDIKTLQAMVQGTQEEPGKIDAVVFSNGPTTSNDLFEYCRRPPCGFWGDPKRDTRSADFAILDRILHDLQQQEEAVQQDSGGNATTEVPLEQVKLTPPLVASIPEEQTAEAKAMADDLVEGLDDLDKLFEGVTTPDEFDVASNGASIQDVIMGSATRVLLKRISVGARIAQQKTFQAIRTIVQHVRRNMDDSYSEEENTTTESQGQNESRPLQFLRDSNGNIAPFRRLRNQQGELAPLHMLRNVHGDFAPLQRFRNTDGDFAPLRRFRNADGNFDLPSKEAVWNGVKASAKMLLRGIRRIEAIIDRVLEGSSSKDDDDDNSLHRSFAAKIAAAE